MAWITTESGKHINTDWFDEDERKKYEQIEKNKLEGAKRQAESDSKTEYADDLPEEMRKTAVNFSNKFQSAVDEIVESHNNKEPNEDLEDYVWSHIYDHFPKANPNDMSEFVFENNKGQYDEQNGKVGLCHVSFSSRDNKNLSIEMKFKFNWMSDIDEGDLQDMGIYKKGR